jgi:hypothetical protein
MVLVLIQELQHEGRTSSDPTDPRRSEHKPANLTALIALMRCAGVTKHDLGVLTSRGKYMKVRMLLKVKFLVWNKIVLYENFRGVSESFRIHLVYLQIRSQKKEFLFFGAAASE